MIYPNNIEQKIDFHVIRHKLSSLCASDLGRECIEQMRFMHDPNTLRPILQQTQQMTNLLNDASISVPQGDIVDLREPIMRIRVEGLYLDESELFALKRILDYATELERFFHSLDPIRFASLITLPNIIHQDNDNLLTNIVRQIDQLLDRYGKLKDNASPELARIRKELALAQGSVSRAMNAILKKAQSDGFLDKDATPTLREGRLVLPIPPAFKRKIGGIVHDESATGKTLFIEPQQVVEANNHIRELEAQERRERIRILIHFTQQLKPNVNAILSVSKFLARYDFLRAKALLAQSLNAIAPELVPQPFINWVDAKHAVLYLNFMATNKSVVPLSIQLNTPQHDSRILVISGPNAGGKSVCLKTVALLQYMFQCGLLVPMKEASQMGIFKKIMIDIGDEQSIADDLSTYSSHLSNMKYFIRNADENTLFLIDEFGTGTEPIIGGAIAESILDNLHQKQSIGIVTTHYSNLKHYAEQTPGIINGAMLYDRGATKPLFQLSIGQAGSSFAVEIARQIGLPEAIIQQATQLVGEEHIDYDKQLQNIARDKRYWENKRKNIRLKEKQLEEKIANYEEKLSGIKVQKKQIIEEAKNQAAELLKQSNATIERTIREIKEAKAEKEKTKQARKKVEALKQTIDSQPKNKQSTTPANNNTSKVLKDFSELKMLTKNPVKVIQQTSNNTYATSSIAQQMRQKKLAFKRELDLRGCRVDEALEILISYVDDAVMVGADVVTILHGTGTGALKQLTRDYLTEKAHSMRKLKRGNLQFHDGDPNRGGAGITVIEIS